MICAPCLDGGKLVFVFEAIGSKVFIGNIDFNANAQAVRSAFAQVKNRLVNHLFSFCCHCFLSTQRKCLSFIYFFWVTRTQFGSILDFDYVRPMRPPAYCFVEVSASE
jgi:hypothetical protein